MRRKVLRPALAVLAATVVLVAALQWRSTHSYQIFFGVDVPSGKHSDAAQLGQAVAHPVAVQNVFVKLDSTFTVAQLQQLHQGGVEPMVSLEPWSVTSRWTGAAMPQYRLSEITAGRYDDQLHAIATVLKDYGKPVLLRFAHEMNGNWYPWAESVNGNRSGDYVAAWRHVYSIVRSGPSKVRMVWAPNRVGRSSPGSSFGELYPGDRWVDEMGLTSYGHAADAGADLDPTYRLLAALGHRPIILAETGADGADRASWLSTLGQYLRAHHRIHGFVWFNTTPQTTGASGDYAITTPGEAADFRRLLDSLPLARTAH